MVVADEDEALPDAAACRPGSLARASGKRVGPSLRMVSLPKESPGTLEGQRADHAHGHFGAIGKGQGIALVLQYEPQPQQKLVAQVRRARRVVYPGDFRGAACYEGRRLKIRQRVRLPTGFNTAVKAIWPASIKVREQPNVSWNSFRAWSRAPAEVVPIRT